MPVRPLGQEDTLEKGMGTHTCILAGESHGQRSLVGYSPLGGKESSMSEVTEQTHMCMIQDGWQNTLLYR